MEILRAPQNLKMVFLIVLVATAVVATRSEEVETYGNASEVQHTFNWGHRDQVSNKFNCPAIYGRYAHPQSCEYFFECRFGLAVLMHCNRGYLYDQRREQCRESRRVHCKITGTGREDQPEDLEDEVFKCPYIWGTFAHPRDCSKYYICIYKTPTLHQCHSSELYDDRARRCLPRNRVNCGNRIGQKRPNQNFKCPRSCGVFDHPDNCNSFIVCVDNVPSVYACPQNELFDTASKKCVSKDLVTCNKRTNQKMLVAAATTSEEAETFGNASEVQNTFGWIWGFRDRVSNKFNCPAIYGRYPHSQSCEYFFECRFGLPVLMHCNRGYLYDQRKEQCRESRRVQCKITGTGGEDEPEDREDGVFQCPYIWGTFAHPRDCSKYYVCFYKAPALQQCPRSQLFDDRLRKCLPQNRVNCGNRIDKKKPQLNFKCPKSCGVFDHPDNCNSFIVCVDNVPSVYACPQNQLFDTASKKCMSIDLVTCNKGINPDDSKKTTESVFVTVTTDRPERTTRVEVTTAVPEFTQGPNKFFCPFPDGRFVDPEDCSRYYDCRAGVPDHRQCPAYHLYDERQEECRKQDEVRCGNRPGGKGDDIPRIKDEYVWCPYDWGTFSHPVDCSKFVVCIYSVPTVYSCRKNELFDEASRRCLPSHLVDCGERINPDDPFRPGGRTTTQVHTTRTTPVATPRPQPETTRPPATFQPITTELVTRPPPSTTKLVTRPPPSTTKLVTRPPPSTAIPDGTTSKPYSTERPGKKPNTPPPTTCREDDIDCIKDETGNPEGWFDCPGMFGHYPHGASRQLFIHCDRWRPFVKSCADGTEFDPQLLVCVWKRS